MAKKVMRGYELVAEGLKAAGIEHAFGYPGTPATAVMEALERAGIPVTYSANEIVAAGEAIGYALAGGFPAVVYKHLGQHVAHDAIVAAAYAELPMLVIVGTDPEPSSSQNAADPRWLFVHSSVPFVEIGPLEDAVRAVKEAAEVALKYSTPAGVVFTKRQSYGLAIYKKENPIKKPEPKSRIKDWERNYQLPFNSEKLKKHIGEKMEALREWAEKTSINRVVCGNGKEKIIAEATLLPEIAEDAKEVLALATYPLPSRKIRKFLNGNEKPVVAEENGKFYALLVPSALTGIDYRDYSNPLEAFYGIKKKEVNPREIPANLCPGCPHHYTYMAINEALSTLGISKEEIAVIGDRGCYNRGGLRPYRLLDAVMYMGGSIQIATGIKRKDPRAKVIAVIGDSTWHHAGYVALKDAVTHGASFFLAILDNSITAMTGHQPSPSSFEGYRGIKRRIAIEDELEALGVPYQIVNPLKDYKGAREATVRGIEEAFFDDRLNTVIYRAPCVLFLQRVGKRNPEAVRRYLELF